MHENGKIVSDKIVKSRTKISVNKIKYKYTHTYIHTILTKEEG